MEIAKPLNRGWTLEAACGQPSSPDLFSIDERVSPDLNKTRLRLGQEICSWCPVAQECLDDSSTADRFHTIRGGLWPTGLAPAKRGRPRRQRVPGKGVCKRGHDRAVVGSIFGSEFKCYQCYEDALDHGSRYKEELRMVQGSTLWAPLPRYEPGVGTCGQGHDLTAPESLTALRLCYRCKQERSAEQSAERKRQKRERDRQKKLDTETNSATMEHDSNSFVLLDANRLAKVQEVVPVG